MGELQVIHAATVKDCSALHAAPKERMLESTDQPICAPRQGGTERTQPKVKAQDAEHITHVNTRPHA